MGVQGTAPAGWTLSLRNHLAVRETVRANLALRDRYAAVKKRIAAKAANNIDDYGKSKNALIQEILAAAGFIEAEQVTIDTVQVPSHDEVPR
jgi:hypothetical protein